MILQMGWANLPRAERLAKHRAYKREYMRVWRRDPEHRAYRALASTRTTRRTKLTHVVHVRMDGAFQSRKLPSMKERDITAEGLLGCTYDEYDRYLCKWQIWRDDVKDSFVRTCVLRQLNTRFRSMGSARS